MMSTHQNQIYYSEFRNQLLSGDAKSRLLQLTNRLQGILPNLNSNLPITITVTTAM